MALFMWRPQFRQQRRKAIAEDALASAIEMIRACSEAFSDSYVPDYAMTDDLRQNFPELEDRYLRMLYPQMRMRAAAENFHWARQNHTRVEMLLGRSIGTDLAAIADRFDVELRNSCDPANKVDALVAAIRGREDTTDAVINLTIADRRFDEAYRHGPGKYQSELQHKAEMIKKSLRPIVDLSCMEVARNLLPFTKS